jgi:hypothetical protein
MGADMYQLLTSLIICLLLSNLALAADRDLKGPSSSEMQAQAESTLVASDPSIAARGPGTLFTSIDAAVIDALTYGYLQARRECSLSVMRGGTIYPVGDHHFSYGEAHRAKESSLHKISYILKPADVARYHAYPVSSKILVNRMNEKPSQKDLRSVEAIDPLHRPLFILHPSLEIRKYAGADAQSMEVGSLRASKPKTLIAGRCSNDAPPLKGAQESNRVAETRRPFPLF